MFEHARLLATGAWLDAVVPRSSCEQGTKVARTPPPREFGPDRARSTLHRQPPRVGEHNGEVLGQAGFSPAEIAALVASGTVVSV